MIISYINRITPIAGCQEEWRVANLKFLERNGGCTSLALGICEVVGWLGCREWTRGKEAEGGEKWLVGSG